ncbi:unnamed protein product, partial [Choristocarpus tenellus]
LQILARGNCFDVIEQLYGISESTAQTTFHRFCECFACDMYSSWIYLPEGEDLGEVMHTYGAEGFPGAVGSTDVTRVRWERVPISDAPYYIGREGYMTVAYEATVDHTGFARRVTAGFPGAKNDKTTIRYDGAIQKLRNDP